ncbi:MAG: hypothetical protein R3C15_21225 [Thermoleophilia bacterium]
MQHVRKLPRRAALGLATAGAALAAVGVAAGAPPPIWEPTIGPAIAGIENADDAVAQVPLGTFAFPFYGVTYTGATTITVDTNGVIRFGAAQSDNTPTSEELVTGVPAIAGFWSDFDAADIDGSGPVPDGGAVHLNTFAGDDGDPAVDRMVITWDADFFGCEARPDAECHGTAQVQLFESGKIVFGYDAVATPFGAIVPPAQQKVVVGVSKGGGTLPTDDPGGTDVSVALPITATTSFYEVFQNVTPAFDLQGRNLVLLPSGSGGFVVDNPVNLAVAIADTPDPAALGGTIGYAVTVQNNGTLAATGVSLVDTLSPGLTLTGATPSQGTCSGATCALGTIPAGGVASVTFTAQATAAGTLASTVVATAAEAGDPAADNAATATTVVEAPFQPPPGPTTTTGTKGTKGCTIVGTSGNDRLRGTAKRDVICGLGGNDRIDGLGGNDVLRGGAGNDELRGGGGNDLLKGGAGRDVVIGGAGNDDLQGGPGNDELDGGPGKDNVAGGPGRDTGDVDDDDRATSIERRG